MIFFCWKNEVTHLFLSQARRRYLKNLLQSAKHESASISSSPPHRRPSPCIEESIIPGYTVLVVDTNILLSSFFAPSSLLLRSSKVSIGPSSSFLRASAGHGSLLRYSITGLYCAVKVSDSDPSCLSRFMIV